MLYAYDKGSHYHGKAKSWLSDLLSGRCEVGFPLVTLLGFLRLASNIKVFSNPLSPAKACSLIELWLATPSATIIEPGARHFSILNDLLSDTLATSTLTTDAHIAALAIEHKATIHTNDIDFKRFRGTKCFNPLHA